MSSPRRPDDRRGGPSKPRTDPDLGEEASSAGLRLRRAARALVVDPTDDAVLLACFARDRGNYWVTPGGGLEPGESVRAGLRRELDEELGRPDLAIGPLLCTRISRFTDNPHFDGQSNDIFVVYAPRFTPRPRIGWEGLRAEGVTDLRWWTPDEIDAADPTEWFVPDDLVRLVRSVRAAAAPLSPRPVGATSFGRAAAAYHHGRPRYPDEAVAWLTADVPSTSTVVDVGAGTGKLTQTLVRFGFSVHAVDPDPAMLASLADELPAVATSIGSAESTPLEDQSVECALFGQSWHWVEPIRASREQARILTPDGTLGLIWNIRDERSDWVAAMTDAIGQSPAERMIADDDVIVGEPFSTPTRMTLEWSRPMTRAELEAMVQSRSSYITAAATRRRRIDRAVATILDGLGLHGDDRIDAPYVTYAFRARRA